MEFQKKRSISRWLSFTLFLALIVGLLQDTGCANFQKKSPHEVDTPARGLAYTTPASRGDRYLRDIQPILSSRCVVCHSCVDAPCQLHLDSYAGVRRGATYTEMGSNVFEVPPTRDKDAQTTLEWREKKFFPVIRDFISFQKPNDPEKNLKESILYRLVEQGFKHNQSGFSLKALADHRDRDNVCVSNPTSVADFQRQYPAAGMPYGLPALDLVSFEILRSWIADGAPGPSLEATRELTEPSRPDIIGEWEAFLNQSLKSRLAARFIYEHAFMAHIHFDGMGENEYFELVRSYTPFPEPVLEIVTQRPYDSPGEGGSKLFYYRFKKVTQTIVRKTHIVWELDHQKLLSLRSLFLDAQWNPKGDSALIDPGYESTNPFEYFAQIPAEIRYRFMIQNSRLIVNAMIRGPVCTGRVATNAIRDHFWVFFLDPASDVTVLEPKVGFYEWAPLGTQVTAKVSRSGITYNQAMERYKPQGFSIQDIWNGDGNNINAALTVLRHETSATVHYGLEGGLPETAWVLNFSNFERIYYNLVVDFKPWGSDLHKLGTWISMSSHRSEAEERFISFLPSELRSRIRSQWTRGVGGAIENFCKRKYSDGITSLVQVDSNPCQSLMDQFIQRMPPQTLSQQKGMLARYRKRHFEAPAQIRGVLDWERALAAISSRKDQSFAQFLPDIFFVRVQDQSYTLITHRSYKFNNLVTLEDLAYEPEKDAVVAMRGLYGDHPELFVDLSLGSADRFLSDLQKIQSDSDWQTFKNTYGIRRNDPRFWTMLDWFHEWDKKTSPLEAGVFDVSQYDLDE